MNTSIRLLLAGLALSPMAFAHEALAQDASPAGEAASDAIDPDAKDFITRFRERLQKITDISCTVEQTSTSDGKSKTFRGDVLATIIRVPGGRGAGMYQHFKFTLRQDSGDVVYAFDGKNAYRIDHGKKTFASVEAADGQAYPPAATSQLYPTWPLRDVLSDPNAKIVAAKFLPDAVLNGEECKVVEYTVRLDMPAREEGEKPSAMLLTQIRHVGAADLLPRKIDSKVSYSGPMAEEMNGSSFVGIYTNVKANTNPKASQFTLTQIDGYSNADVSPTDLGVPSNEPPKLKFAAGDTAPDFTLKTPAGQDVALANLKGKVVLLDFWATWCGPCIAAMPSIQRLHEKYEGKPVVILGVNTWERGAADKAQKFMEKNKYTYGLLLKGDDLAEAYGVPGIPTLVLIGPDGKILHIGVGFGPDEEKHLSEMIDKAIAGK
ncbi:MAG: redoxin domain-containing protein [Phycisphaeraceae bacterium]|nr:redoxin domain-containing protein [Phycisphaeraceae bacterium]